MTASPSTLLIACGALAREITILKDSHGWDHLNVQCLPANLHNRPQLIPEQVREKILEGREKFERIMVLYGDCGTGGLLDRVLEEEGVERIEGPHCYEFYAGAEEFRAIVDTEPCSFYLTDFLVRHFDTLIIKGLGIDRFPQLMDDYFGNYVRLVYLAQFEDAELKAKAEAAAERLGLEFDYRFTGYGGLQSFISPMLPEIEKTAESMTAPKIYQPAGTSHIGRSRRRYTVRQWSVRHARALEWFYDLFADMLLNLHPLWNLIGYARVEAPLVVLERTTKGFLFDCQMCGQCVLSSTGMACPMNCPKLLRNGPCGGVRANGNCEVEADMPCVWTEAWKGAQEMKEGGNIEDVQLPHDQSLRGTSSWLRATAKRAAERAAGKEQ